MDMTTREAAARLGVNMSRVRALIASGGLTAHRVGQQWLVNSESVAAHARMIAGHGTGRPMSQRIAWATAALADGIDAEWVSASERSRVRRRVRNIASPEVLLRWLSTRMDSVRKYQVEKSDLADLLATHHVVATGVSAAANNRLGLTVTGQGDAYVSPALHDRLVEDHFLVETRQGNLVLRIVEADWHLRTARPEGGRLVATRLIVGVDLADDADARTRALGRELIQSVLRDITPHE